MRRRAIKAGTIAGKLSAVLHLPPRQLTNGVAYVVAAYQECIERGLKISRCRKDAEKSASPYFVGCTVERIRPGLALGSGRPRSLAVSRVGLLFRGEVGRIFASSTGVGHPEHFLRRDVALYNGERRLTSLQCQVTSIEVRFRGHKGDQAQQGSVIVRTRDHASGTRSGVGAGGGAVALMVELLSVYPTMPKSAPLSSFRCGNKVRVWRYPEALAALCQVAPNAEGDPGEVGLHSLRIAYRCSHYAGGRRGGCYRG